EKADLKSRSDSTSVPPLDSIYTTPTGFHHHHHHPHHAAHHPHQNGTPGSPEAMKQTPNSETDCGTVKESLTDEPSTAGTSPLADGAVCGGPDTVTYAHGTTTATAATSSVAVEDGDRCVREDSSPGTSLSRSAGPTRSHDRSQGHCAPQASGTRLESYGSNADGASEQTKVRQPAKASDYGLERFNRLLERLDRGNFLIKTSFKKSYSLILMSARGSIPTVGDAPEVGGVESSGADSTTSTNTGTGDSKTDGSGPTVGCNSSSISNSSNSSAGAPSSGTSGLQGASFKRPPHTQHTDKRPTMGGSLRGWYPRTRGILIKANSSSGIYQLAGIGRTGSGTLDQVDNAPQLTQVASSKESPTERQTSGQRKAIPVPDQPETTPTNTTAADAGGHNYNGNSLAPGDAVKDGAVSQLAGSGQDHTTSNESDELCRSEVYDNDSGSGSGGRASQQLLNNHSATVSGSPRQAPHTELCRNNYENIRPSSHRSRQRLSSLDGTNHTLSPGGRKPTARKKSNAASASGSEWDEDCSWPAYGMPDDIADAAAAEAKLSSSVPHTTSGYYWQSSECAVPTRFFQRQDYVQPGATEHPAALDFPLDPSAHAPEGAQGTDRERGTKRTQGKKRWLSGKASKSKTISSGLDHGTDIKPAMGNKGTDIEHPFQLTALFSGGTHSGNQSRKRHDTRVPQLKNINLHFPNKTSHQQQQQQQHDYDDHSQHELRSGGGSREPTGNMPAGALFHQPTGYHQLALPP
uniref:Uncharacterized protein n=1 Tax=Anopheles maculatus TaxID=74869 RepID=A0A182SN81_9DIPT